MKKPEECCPITAPLTDQSIDATAGYLNNVATTLHRQYGIGIDGVCRLLMITGVGIAMTQHADLEWITEALADSATKSVEIAERKLGLRVRG